MKLTIGMATYDDYDGVFFTIQSLRMYHTLCQTSDVEFIVLDSNPTSAHGKACKTFVETWVKGKYIAYEGKPSSFNKYEIVKYATGDYILIVDCHVILQANAIDNLMSYYTKHSASKDLIQGPLLYDDMFSLSTHFDRVWRGDMFGIWATDNKALEKNEPFEIQMQGMGLLSFKRSAWPGINKHFSGFGGEEGYIAEKFRQKGGKNICLPNLMWNHRFTRPNGVVYPNTIEDRVRNYFIGCLDLWHDPQHPFLQDIKDHFSTIIPASIIDDIFQRVINIYNE